MGSLKGIGIMTNRLLIVLGFGLVLARAAIADTPAPVSTAQAPLATGKAVAPATKPAKSIQPMEMTCEEFLSYDEITRPQIVFLSEGLNGNGKPGHAVFDIERTNSLVPVLIEDCQREPKTSYWQKMKSEFKRIF
jgi:hypothetical protein